MATPFAKMEAKNLPTQAHVGKISAVGPFVPSKGSDGTYITGPIAIDAYGAGMSQKHYFNFRPDWFTEKFHAEINENFGGSVEKYFQDTYGNQEYQKTDGSIKNAAKSFTYVYQTTIANGEKTSFLQSIFPDDKEFEVMVQAAFKQQFDGAEPDLNDVAAFFSEQLVGKKIGYILSQKKIRTNNVDANGKAIYLRDNSREIKSFFSVEKKKLEALVKSAKNSKTGFMLTFDPDMVLD